jgi:cytochrome c oxidase subunit 3
MAQHLAHHFDDMEQQHESATLGMWLFLATEVLLFGGLFTGYIVYRVAYPEVFAEAAHHLAVPEALPWYLQSLFLGTLNTAILLCSSLCVALAGHAAQEEQRWQIVGFLVATIVLGGVFLAIKFLEYYLKYEEGLVPGIAFHYQGLQPNVAQLYFLLYFLGTGLHALHMLIGMGVLAVIAVMAAREQFSAAYFTPVEMSGFYWHFVDVVWVFLFPLFYLIGLTS